MAVFKTNTIAFVSVCVCECVWWVVGGIEVDKLNFSKVFDAVSVIFYFALMILDWFVGH